MSDRRVTERLAVEGTEESLRRLEQFGARGAAALDRVGRAGEPASRGLLAVDAASRELQGRADGLAARLGPAGAALQALGPAGTIAAAGMAAVGLALGKGVAEAEATNQAHLRLQAVLRATAGASGQTLASIEETVEGISRSTLAGEDAVRAAAGQLLTFKAVAGDAFGETLRLAQDLAAIGFGTLEGNAVQLGKALEDPERGLDALRRTGISFSQAQKDVIEKLVETGRAAEAQQLILKAVREQVGGAGEAEAGGLAGAFHVLTENVGDFLEAIARRSGVLDAFVAQMRGLASAAKEATDAVAPSLADRIAALDRQIDAARDAGPRSRAAAEARQVPERAGLVRSLDNQRQRADRDALQAAAAQAAAQAAAADERQAAAAAKRREESEKDRLAVEAAHRERIAREAADYDRGREEASKRAVAAIREIEAEEAKRARSLAEFVDSAEEEARLSGLTVEARREQLVLLEAQKKAGRELTEAEAQRLTAATRLTAANERQAEAAKRAAEEAARIAERSIQRVVDFGADALFRYMKGEAGSFWEEFKDLGLRAFAQIAAEAVIRPIVAPIVADAVQGVLGGGAGGGIGSLFGQLGQSAATSFLGDAIGLPSIGSMLGFGGGGLAAATSAASAAGGTGLAAWAAAEGTLAAGAGAGLFGGGGILGLGAAGGPVAIAGLAAAGLLGSKLLKGKPQIPRGHANIVADPATGRLLLGASAGDNGFDPNGAIQQAQQVIAQLNALLDATGGRFEAPPGGYITGIAGGDAPGPKSVEEAIAAALQNPGLGQGKLVGVTPEAIQTALAGGVDKVAQSAAIAAGIERAILAIVDPTAAALAALEDEHKARLEAVEAVGGSIVEAERLHGLKREQVLEQARERELAAERQARDALRQAEAGLGSAAGAALSRAEGTAGLLAQTRLGLALGPDSILSPGERLSAAREQSARLAGLARGGDFAAAEQAARAAQTAIGVAREVFAGGPGFAAVFREENAQLSQVQAVFERESEFLVGAFGRLEAAARETTATTRRGLEELQAEVQRLRTALEARAA